MAFVVLQNLHASSLVLNVPLEPVNNIVKTLGQEKVTQLLHHLAAEQSRNLYYLWEQAQILIALVLGVCLYFATQKRLLSLVLCAVMASLVMFQFFAITPELTYRGRAADFAPADAGSGVVVRMLLLYQMLVVTEGLKLVVGGILASYLFAFRTSRKRSSRREVGVLDPSPIDR